ncbi:hypothetical protein Tco_0230857 [Tanacetum coccineum]
MMNKVKRSAKCNDTNMEKKVLNKTSNSNNERPNKRMCNAERFEAIKYSLGPNEEYIAIRICEYDTWERNEDTMSQIYQEIFQKKDKDWKVMHTVRTRLHSRCEDGRMAHTRAHKIITKYLVNISKRQAFWSLNDDILKITILKTNMPYLLRKIWRIRASTHQRPQRKEAQYAVSKRPIQLACLGLRKKYRLSLGMICPSHLPGPCGTYSTSILSEQLISKAGCMPKINDKAHFELKGQFLKELRENTNSGSDNEDANENIEKVLEIVDLFHIPEVTQDQIMLRVFPVSLTGVASRWLKKEPAGSINTWETLKKKFLSKYCPPARTAKKMEEINNFQQEPDETLYQAWERFKDLLLRCPQHYIMDMQEVILFYKGLNVPTTQILDIKCGPYSKKSLIRRENSAKRQKTSEHGTFVFGESSSGQEYESEPAKLRKVVNEMLRQRCNLEDEHQYHIDQMQNFLKYDIV